jgi:hypothetical protein
MEHADRKSQIIFLTKKTQRKADIDTKLKETKGRWTSEEHLRFIEVCLRYGCNWRKVRLL